jgi:hypothetical protein
MNPDRWQPEYHNPQDESCTCGPCQQSRARRRAMVRRWRQREEAGADHLNPNNADDFPNPQIP